MRSPVKLILFGSTGDLARLKILPALYELKKEGQLPDNFELVAVGRRKYDTAKYLNFLASAEFHPLEKDISNLNPQYIQLDWNKQGGFQPLWNHLDKNSAQDTQYSFFIALNYDVVEMTLSRMDDASSKSFLNAHLTKILLEKPFGGSLKQAQSFNKHLARLFEPNDIYRNDHVIFKKPILAFDADPQVESKFIDMCSKADRMRIVYAEKMGVGDRASYFEKNGISVDMFQSHLLQIAAMALHECSLANLKECKAQFISQLELLPESVVKGRYQGYTDLKGVSADSSAETFLRACFISQLSEWNQLEFEFVTGKKLADKEVIIELLNDNKIIETISIQPRQDTSALRLPEADGRPYHRLVIDFLNDDQSHFVSAAEVEAQWQATSNLKRILRSTKVIEYPPGSSWSEIIT